MNDTDNFDVDLGFEDETQPVAPAVAPTITNFPAAPSYEDDRRSPTCDAHGARSGTLRRVAVGISAAWWEIMMKKHGAADQVHDAFLQAPPPTDLHYQYAVELLEALGSKHRHGLWGLLLTMSGKELISASDVEVDLGVIAQPMTVKKSLIIGVSDFLVLTAHAGLDWWLRSASELGVTDATRDWARETFQDLERSSPGCVKHAMDQGRKLSTVQALEDAMEKSRPDDPEQWGYSRLGAALNVLAAPPLEEVIMASLKKNSRVQFNGDRMIQWLNQVHQGMSSTLSRMTPEKKRMFEILNPQVRSELMRRSASTQETLLNKWIQQFKIMP